MLTRVLAATCWLTAVGGVAMAGDNVTPELYSPYPISGYVELFGGFNAGSAFWDAGVHDGTWSGSAFGGAGRAALKFSPTFSVQGDVWTSVFAGTGIDNGVDEYSYTNTYSGIGGHLTAQIVDGLSLGALASLGAISDWGTFGNLGVEAVYSIENWRLYGQAGLTSALSGQASSDAVHGAYVHGVVAYYINPNFALSGNLGASDFHSTQDNGNDETGVSWGARLEYKPDLLPVSGFIAYQGFSRDGISDSESVGGTEHTVVVGLRIPLNGETLQEMDQNVGLADMNGLFGEPFPH